MSSSPKVLKCVDSAQPLVLGVVALLTERGIPFPLNVLTHIFLMTLPKLPRLTLLVFTVS